MDTKISRLQQIQITMWSTDPETKKRLKSGIGFDQKKMHYQFYPKYLDFKSSMWWSISNPFESRLVLVVVFFSCSLLDRYHTLNSSSLIENRFITDFIRPHLEHGWHQLGPQSFLEIPMLPIWQCRIYPLSLTRMHSKLY